MQALRRLTWLLWVVLPLGVVGAQPAFDALTLATPANLISNPSFEAVVDGQPRSFDFLTSPQFLSLTTAEARHGSQSVLADVPAGSSLEAAATQDVPARPGCLYEFSAWAKIAEDRGGQARLVLQMRSAEGIVLAQEQVVLRGAEEAWRPMVVRLKAPPETAFVTLGAPSVVGGMKVYYDALRLAVVAGPRGRPAASLVQGLRTSRVEATWLVLQWSGPAGAHEVSYRHRSWPRDRWFTSDPIAGFTYSVVGLRAGTSYDFRVRYRWPEHYDEAGQAVKSPVEPPPTRLLTVETEPWQPRVVGALRLWPPLHLSSFVDGQSAPRIVTWGKSLYVIEGHEGGIFLSKVRPADFTVEWTRALLPTQTELPLVEQVSAAAVLGDQLYVLVSQSAPGPPALTREALYTYSLLNEEVEGEPLLIADASEGGVQVYRQQLWVLWSSPDEQGAPRVRLAPLTDGALGEPHLWQDAPSDSLRDLSLGVFADELLVMFTDEGWSQRRRGYAPLGVVQFNGASFHWLRKIADLGRNTDAAGVQLGSTFYLFDSTDVPWVSYGGRFRDLRLTTLLPEMPGGETITYLDDMKHNLSCSATVFENSLFVAHEKLEREPSASGSPPHSYGTFLSRIDLGPPPPARSR